jgi:hypothetical protein
MTELSNAVTVLIARMESHPDDFSLYTPRRAKFAGVAEGLYGLAGMDKEKAGAYWFLTDADKEALLEAWKKYHRTAMDKEIMEAIFDDGEGARELAEVQQQLYQAQQRAMIKNQMMQSTGTFRSGQIAPINPAQNSGLLSSAGSAFQGLFK